MTTASSPADRWNSAKQSILDQITSRYGKLDQAFSNADQTFRDRTAKVTGPLADLLEECRSDLRVNYDSAKAQEGFLRKLVSDRDAALPDLLLGKQPEALHDTMAHAGDTTAVARLLGDTAKMVIDGLCLCVLLEVLLGHDEAKAFEVGAKSEFIGALGDPGQGVVTLLRRLYAVSTRTLRTDQDTAAVLQNLHDFRGLMVKWREVTSSMASGRNFGQALEDVFVDVP